MIFLSYSLVSACYANLPNDHRTHLGSSLVSGWPPDRILLADRSAACLTNDQAAMGTNRFLIAALRAEYSCPGHHWTAPAYLNWARTGLVYCLNKICLTLACLVAHEGQFCLLTRTYLTNHTVETDKLSVLENLWSNAKKVEMLELKRSNEDEDYVYMLYLEF